MIKTSREYKEAIIKNREFSIQDIYTLSDGRKIEMDAGNFVTYAIDESVSETGKITFGSAVSKKYTACLNNSEGKFDWYNFKNCRIEAKVGLRLADGSVEVLPKGVYFVTKAFSTGLTVKIEANDSMTLFDKPYSISKLQYPATHYAVLKDACDVCGVDGSLVLAGVEEGDGYRIYDRPSGEKTTFRDVVSYCAQLEFCYAKINGLNRLAFSWYRMRTINNYIGDVYDNYLHSGYLDGGHFDRMTGESYISGNNRDAGEFTDKIITPGFDAEFFGSMDNYHHIYEIGSQEIDTSDIRIAGVQIVTYNNNDEPERSVRATYEKEGYENYILQIKENPFIKSIGDVLPARLKNEFNEESRCGNIRQLKVTCKADPSIEAGDIMIVTDRKQDSYRSIITRTKFALGCLQKVECDAGTYSDNCYALNEDMEE